MKKLFVIGLVAYWVMGLWGCAGIKETTRGILGTSTKILEDKRAEAEVWVVDYDYFTCYHKVLDVLKEKGSYVYAKMPDLIAFYVSATDTTPVGVFFKEIDKQKTELSVSSPSRTAKEDIFEGTFPEVPP